MGTREGGAISGGYRLAGKFDKFSGWVYLSDHSGNFRCVGSDSNVDLRVKSLGG
jgi:hypothetical protein